MVLKAITGLLNVVGRWWWPGARGKVYLPPDVQRQFSWPKPRVTRGWLAAFLVLITSNYHRILNGDKK